MSSNIFARDADAIRVISGMESSANHDWRSFKEALARRIQELAIMSCLTEDDVRSRWMQGRVQELKDLLESFATARDTRVALSTKRDQKGAF